MIFVCCDRWIFNLEEPDSALAWSEEQQSEPTPTLPFPPAEADGEKNAVWRESLV